MNKEDENNKMMTTEELEQVAKIMDYINDEDKNSALEDTLNKWLKPYNLSLWSRIEDVLARREDGVIRPRVKMTNGKFYPLPEYIHILKEKELYDRDNLIKELLADIDKIALTKAAYERAAENPTLQAFELLFRQSINFDCPNKTLERSLSQIAYGLEVAYLIPTIKKEKKQIKPAITAPAIALFCRILNDTVKKKPTYETNEKYCQDVCTGYKLQYNDKVRQWFSKKPLSKHFTDLKETIIPLLDKDTAQLINDYLVVNHPNK